ncbi:MAG TPA: aromatic amino acid lyase, partial [Polyangiaceae bacterium]|nr:aromatic amino acid lyase [Polyangiaceae bacterium]
MTHAPPVAVGTELRIADFVEVARRGRRATLAPSAAPLVHASRAAVERILNAGDQAPHVYGVNTGFGALSETRISAGDILKLQLNLVRSHCTGVGTDLSRDAVRGMLLLRAQTLALGHSGVRAIVIETLLQMLAADLLPRVPSQGSVGASGDLAPLAHLALGAIGEGEATLAGERMPAAQAFQRAGLTPLTLQTKEGLALINGTQFMTALGALSLFDADRISGAADIAAALSVDALKGSSRPFDARLMALRRHPGQAQVAENLRNYLGGSEIMESHRDCDKVQDPYSLRSVPQVHGTSRDALGFGRN